MPRDETPEPKRRPSRARATPAAAPAAAPEATPASEPTIPAPPRAARSAKASRLAAPVVPAAPAEPTPAVAASRSRRPAKKAPAVVIPAVVALEADAAAVPVAAFEAVEPVVAEPVATELPHPVPVMAEQPGSLAVLEFREDWRELRQGEITAGGSLVVQYAPARLSNGPAVGAWDVVGYARFLPGGQVRHATLATPSLALASTRDEPAGVVATEIPVPRETTQVELWFQRVDDTGATSWDSRFGANYRFEVVPPTPAAEPTGASGRR